MYSWAEIKQNSKVMALGVMAELGPNRAQSSGSSVFAVVYFGEKGVSALPRTRYNKDNGKVIITGALDV